MYRESTVLIPPSPTVDETSSADTQHTPRQEFRWPQTWQDEVARYNATTEGFLPSSSDQLTSPTSLSLNSNLPSWAGIASLVDDGKIRPAGDYQTDPDLMQFSEAFNTRYRTRFDPDFRFEPRIDFVLPWTFEDEIPRDLRHADGTPVTFLRAVPSFEPRARNRGDTGRYCFFSTWSQLVGLSSDNSVDRSQWMSHSGPETFGPEEASTLARLQMEAMRWLEDLRELSTQSEHTQRGYALQHCSLFDVPAEAEVVVLSTQFGRVRGDLRVKHCGRNATPHSISSGMTGEVLGEGPEYCEAGEIDVRIEREGPIFLFLKGSGALQWNFDVSAESNIVGVATVNDSRQTIIGLPEGVSFDQYSTRGRGLPDGCRNSLLDVSPLAGGPAIQLFETMLDRTSGRQIDVLINKGLAPEGDERTPMRVQDYTSFVVD